MILSRNAQASVVAALSERCAVGRIARVEVSRAARIHGGTFFLGTDRR